MESSPNESNAAKWRFPRVWALGLLILIAATWPLWFPGRDPEIPLVPAFPLLPGTSNLALGLANAVSAILAFCLLWLIVRPPLHPRWLWWSIAACLMVSFSVDQHRLQPWAYQSWIYAMIFASMDRNTARRWIIPLAASIYIYSAAGKFDYQFAHTVGQDFLTAASEPLGGIPGNPSERLRAGLALGFPVVEILAGIGLLFPWTRRFAASLAIVMHLTLIAILGPWNRDHSHGVLLWNLLLIAQAWLVLLPKAKVSAVVREQGVADPAARERPSASRFSISGLVVRFVVVTALIAPLLERRGWWDHWTSWSLYSPHTSHVDIEIHQTAWNHLDRSLQSHLREDTNQDGWRLLDLGGWSLEVQHVPTYPQARYQLGIAAEIARRYQLNDEIRARILSSSNRWTGERTEKRLRNRTEIEEATEPYWLLPAPDRSKS